LRLTECGNIIAIRLRARVVTARVDHASFDHLVGTAEHRGGNIDV
jgi:hypothetical protein